MPEPQRIVPAAAITWLERLHVAEGWALHRFQRAGSCTLTVPASAMETVMTALPS